MEGSNINFFDLGIDEELHKDAKICAQVLFDLDLKEAKVKELLIILNKDDAFGDSESIYQYPEHIRDILGLPEDIANNFVQKYHDAVCKCSKNKTLIGLRKQIALL